MSSDSDSCGAQGIVVLGMGRSGTSAITGLFEASGFYVGGVDDQLEPHAANPVGFNERRDTLSLNEEILGALDGNWFDPPPEQSLEDARARFGPRIRTHLDELLAEADGAPIAVKDPRISTMLPLWWPIIGDLLYPVIAVRDPLDIGHSLTVRDGMPEAFGRAAWEVATTRTLRGLRGSTVSIAPYDTLLDSPEVARRLVEQVVDRLRPDYARRVVISDGSDWLRADLRRSRRSDVDHEHFLTVLQQRLWTWLASLPAGEQILAPPGELTMTSAYAEELVGHETARQRGRTEIEQSRSERAQLESELAVLRARESELSAALARQGERLAHLEHAAQSAQQAQAATQATIDVITSSHSWRLTAPARKLGARLRAMRAERGRPSTP